MKKWLLLILLGFALTSIFAISYTNQVISTFTGFDEDDGNGDEDHDAVDNSINFVNVAHSIKNSEMGENIIFGGTNSSGAGDLDKNILSIKDTIPEYRLSFYFRTFNVLYF